MVFLKNGEFSLEEIKIYEGKINHKTFKVPSNQEIPDEIDSYLIPKTVDFVDRIDFIREWQMGFEKSSLNPTIFYSNDSIELVSLDEKYVGIVCKRKNKRSFKTILKDQFNEFMYRPYGKGGDFSFTKAECINDDNGVLEKIFLFDSAGDIVYRWEVDLMECK